ncbi:GNAT family N-acetyltransferase [Saccharothrix isguenensis]
MSTFPPGRPLPRELLDLVQRLFVTSYHRYHYLEDLARADRLGVVALDGGSAVGYASARVGAHLVYLANLLVHRDHRGSGLGRRLEQERYRWSRATGLPTYVSCTCDDPASQQLKLDLGLRPVAVKLGYRRDVSGPGRRSSSVVFTDAPVRMSDPLGPQVARDDRRLRVRFTGTVAEVLGMALRTDPEWYADLLVGPDEAVLLGGVPELAFAGVDEDVRTGRWHACFQVRNQAYHQGVQAQPVVVEAPGGLAAHVHPRVRL